MKPVISFFLNLSLLITILCEPVTAGEETFDRVVFSLGLSGHILLGVGVEHGFNHNHAVQFTVYPLLLPGKGFPFALSTGYSYYFHGSRWRAKLGGEFGLLVSPPDPDKRRVLPLFSLVPGIQYRFNDQQFLTTQIWISYFMGKANVPVAPTAIEFRYGRQF